MDERDIDLSKVNEIDMECDCCDDDDSFCVQNMKPTTVINPNNGGSEVISSDGTAYQPYGFSVDFGDDDLDKPTKVKVISADFDGNDNLHITNNFSSYDDGDYSNVNQIDMECNCCEDDDDDFGMTPTKKNKTFDFGDDEDEFIEKEFIDEDMIEEKKEITQGEVEKDYWSKLQKKHKASNVKGAYTTSMHFAGDPEQEMKDFNHDMGAGIVDAPAGDAGSGGEGCCESKEKSNNYNKLCEELFYIIGFKLDKCDDGYELRDMCTKASPTKCKDMDEVTTNLKPYMDDCFLLPLQIETGEKFDNCQDWCKWYTPEMEKKYPQCKSDINYCDLFANHMNECKF